MRVLLNCDQVFELLTRGPFPSGGPDDSAVERHLGCCADCRQLAEALRPAVALFHESLAPEQAHNLPEYHGSALTPDWHAEPTEPERSPRRLPRHLSEIQLPPSNPPPSAARSDLRGTLQLAAGLLLAVIAGAALFGMAQSLQQLRTRPDSFAAAGYSSRPEVLTEAGRRSLAALQLKSVCLPDLTLNSALASADLVCCTHCHAEAAAGAHSQRVSIARLQQSCLACHQG